MIPHSKRVWGLHPLAGWPAGVWGFCISTLVESKSRSANEYMSVSVLNLSKVYNKDSLQVDKW